MVSGSILMVMDEVEQVGIKLRGERAAASREIYNKRTDLPAFDWGGPNGAYLPGNVREVVARRRVRDDL